MTDEQQDIKTLLEEVRALRRDLELLKISPAINQAISKVATARGPGQFKVTYNVTVTEYDVAVMPPVNIGDISETEGGG